MYMYNNMRVYVARITFMTHQDMNELGRVLDRAHNPPGLLSVVCIQMHMLCTYTHI